MRNALAGVLGLEPRVVEIRHVDMVLLDAPVRLGDRLAAGSRLFTVGVESLESPQMRRALGGGSSPRAAEARVPASWRTSSMRWRRKASHAAKSRRGSPS